MRIIELPGEFDKIIKKIIILKTHKCKLIIKYFNTNCFDI